MLNLELILIPATCIDSYRTDNNTDNNKAIK